jgi:hypothetical protein
MKQEDLRKAAEYYKGINPAASELIFAAVAHLQRRNPPENNSSGPVVEPIIQATLTMDIAILDLSVRSYNALKRMQLDNLDKVMSIATSRRHLLGLRQISDVTADQILDKIDGFVKTLPVDVQTGLNRRRKDYSDLWESELDSGYLTFLVGKGFTTYTTYFRELTDHERHQLQETYKIRKEEAEQKKRDMQARLREYK